MDGAHHIIPPPFRRQNAAEYLLRRLRNDHKNTQTCLALLEWQIAGERKLSPDLAIIDSVLDPFIDSPDDFHHILERKAFRRLWFRMDCFLPRYFDLDESHSTLRDQRAGVVETVDRIRTQGAIDDDGGAVIARYIACVRSAIDVDEKQLFPLLTRHLTVDDWNNLAEASHSYDQIIDAVKAKEIPVAA